MSTSHHHLVGIFYTTIWKVNIQRSSWSPLQACAVRVPLGLYVVNTMELKKETNKGLTSTIAWRVLVHIYFETNKILKRTIRADYCQLHSWVIKYRGQFQGLPFINLNEVIKVKIWRLVQLRWIRGFHRIVFSQMGAQKYTCAFWRLYDPPHCWEKNFNLH